MSDKMYYGGNEVLGIFRGSQNTYKNEVSKSADGNEIFYKSLGLNFDDYEIIGSSSVLVRDGHFAGIDGSFKKYYTNIVDGVVPLTMETKNISIETYKIYGGLDFNENVSPDTPKAIKGVGDAITVGGENKYKVSITVNGQEVSEIIIDKPFYGVGDICDYIFTETDYQPFTTADGNTFTTEDSIFYVGA